MTAGRGVQGAGCGAQGARCGARRTFELGEQAEVGVAQRVAEQRVGGGERAQVSRVRGTGCGAWGAGHGARRTFELGEQAEVGVAQRVAEQRVGGGERAQVPRLRRLLLQLEVVEVCDALLQAAQQLLALQLQRQALAGPQIYMLYWIAAQLRLKAN